MASSTSPVGNYDNTCGGAVDPNYTITYTKSQMVVGAAPLVVTASSVATTYGTAATAISPTYSGFLNGDGASSLTVQPTCTTTAAVTDGVGTYPSSCSGAVDPNYAITYVNGTVPGGPGTDHGDRLVGLDAVRSGLAPDVTADVQGLQNGEGAGVARWQSPGASRGPRHPARSAPTPRRARVDRTPTTPSPTSTARSWCTRH